MCLERPSFWYKFIRFFVLVLVLRATCLPVCLQFRPISAPQGLWPVPKTPLPILVPLIGDRHEAVNEEYNGRARKLGSELHGIGIQQDQRSPIGSGFIEYGHNGLILPPVIDHFYGNLLLNSPQPNIGP